MIYYIATNVLFKVEAKNMNEAFSAINLLESTSLSRPYKNELTIQEVNGLELIDEEE